MTIKASFKPDKKNSSCVIVCHGGNQHGYSVYLKDGGIVFSVRRSGKLVSAEPFAVDKEKASLVAKLAADGMMTLLVNAQQVATANAGGLIPAQPQDRMTIGFDEGSSAGDYQTPDRFEGAVFDVVVNDAKVFSTRVFDAKKSTGRLPSIVVYLSDDHSQIDSSLYGNANVPTPNFEKLTADGITFSHAFAASPPCAPSRAAMLAGLIPARNGGEMNHSYPKPGTPRLIENLRAAGYEVAAFGKVAH